MYLHKISLQPLFLQQTVHQYKSIDSMQLSKMVKGKGIRKKKKKAVDTNLYSPYLHLRKHHGNMQDLQA